MAYFIYLYLIYIIYIIDCLYREYSTYIVVEKSLEPFFVFRK